MIKQGYTSTNQWVIPNPEGKGGLIMCIDGLKALKFPEEGVLLIASYPFKGSTKITMTSQQPTGDAIFKRQLWFKKHHFDGWTGTWSDLCAEAGVHTYSTFLGARVVYIGYKK